MQLRNWGPGRGGERGGKKGGKEREACRGANSNSNIGGATPKFLGGPHPSLHLSPSFPW